MNMAEIERIIPTLPPKILYRVKYLCDEHAKTKDARFVTLILEILKQFRDDPKVIELIKRMR